MNGHAASKTAPTWTEFSSWVGNEDWVAAITLLEVDPHATVRRDAARWLSFSAGDGRMVDGVFVPNPWLDWDEWVADVEGRGRGWSSTEWRLFDVVAGLTTGQPFNIVGVLDRLGSWRVPAWQILMTWGLGGSADQIRAAAGHG